MGCGEQLEDLAPPTFVEFDGLVTALKRIAELGANPLTQHGCESRADLIRHIDKMWQVAREALADVREEISDSS